MQFVLISFISPALTTGAISEKEKADFGLAALYQNDAFIHSYRKAFASISQIILLIIASLPIFSIVFLFEVFRLKSF